MVSPVPDARPSCALNRIFECSLVQRRGLGGTVRPILGRSWDPPNQDVERRFGVIMNPYTQAPVVRQLFVSEPFNNTIAVINLVVIGAVGNEVFKMDSVTRINSPSLNLPVDLAPVQRDRDNPNWASNSTLDQGSDFYVANRGTARHHNSAPTPSSDGAWDRGWGRHWSQ